MGSPAPATSALMTEPPALKMILALPKTLFLPLEKMLQ